MTKEQWLKALNAFYGECLAFWLREGKAGEDAKSLAMMDCKRVKHYPYVPMGPEIPEDIREEWLESLEK